MPEFPRVARLGASVALRQLAEATGIVLAEDGPCPAVTSWLEVAEALRP